MLLRLLWRQWHGGGRRMYRHTHNWSLLRWVPHRRCSRALQLQLLLLLQLLLSKLRFCLMRLVLQVLQLQLLLLRLDLL